MCGKRSKQMRAMALEVAQEHGVGKSTYIESNTREGRGYRRLYQLLKRGMAVPEAVRKAKAA